MKISDDNKIVKVDKCVPLETFISNNTLSKVSKFQLSNIWSIFDVIKKFELWTFIDCDVDKVKLLCNECRLDYDEIIYPLNWAFNPNKGKIVIVDYAE